MSETVAIVLAAGKSMRMKSDRPKVLHDLCGRSMLGYVLSACRLAGTDRILVVVGHGRDAVQERFAADSDITWVEQTQQRGTGHAVLCCREALGDFRGNVLVVAGDMPLVRRDTLAELIESRQRSGDALTLATAVLEDPTGYGRILRDGEGGLEGVVEHADCTTRQREICEVNVSYYCFDARRLFDALTTIEPKGAKSEYYLTDTVRVLREAGFGVSATVSAAPEDALGINSRLDLAVVGRVLQDRIQNGLMAEGVTIVDPDNTWIEAEATVGTDTIVYPFSMIRAGATVGRGCRIGPLVCIAEGQTVADGAVIGGTVVRPVGGSSS